MSEPNFEQIAVSSLPDNATIKDLKRVVFALNCAHEKGRKVLLEENQLFRCPECDALYNIDNRNEFGGIFVCNLCLDAMRTLEKPTNTQES